VGETRILGLVLSARAGNCRDFARHLLPEEDILALGEMRLLPCAGCEYECMHGRACPVEDDLSRVHERLLEADALIVFSPVYDGRPPALFYALEERLPAMWFREAEGFRRLSGKGVALVVVGNRGTKRTLDILEASFRGLGLEIAGTLKVYPNRQPRGGGIAGGLIENEEVRSELESLRNLLS
jgi:multimeric flavodoxin WrbA